jgi:DNA-binding MarR family transcriptional regulator
MSRDLTKRDLQARLGGELRGYLGAADRFDEAVALRLGLSRTEMRCLDLVDRAGTITAGSLAEESGLSTGAVTFLVDRLERAGVATRRRDTEDRRKVFIELVPETAERAWKLHEPMVLAMRELSARYRSEELESICRFLHDARAVYEKHAPPIPET